MSEVGPPLAQNTKEEQVTPAPDVLAQKLECLAHPLRLKMLALLRLAGTHGLPVSTVGEALLLKSTLASHHLKLLLDQGLVSTTKVGSWVVYRVEGKKLELVFDQCKELLLGKEV